MITDAVHLKQQPEPPIVKNGRGAIYVKEDGALYYKSPNGTEVLVTTTVSEAWPVGSVFINIASTNPSVLVGYGTWVRFGEGRMLVSQKGDDVDFDTAEEAGGAKSITQTEAQMPVHTHVQNSHNHTQDAHQHGITVGSGAGDPQVLKGSGSFSTQQTGAVAATNQPTTATNQNTGGGQAMPIMNPYIVVYMWKRTA